jgi:hypothetical protein
LFGLSAIETQTRARLGGNRSQGSEELKRRTMMSEPKDRPAELGAAEKTVREAGGVPTEIFYRGDGKMEVSFVIGSDRGPYTFLWNRQESLTMLHDFVRSKILAW